MVLKKSPIMFLEKKKIEELFIHMEVMWVTHQQQIKGKCESKSQYFISKKGLEKARVWKENQHYRKE